MGQAEVLRFLEKYKKSAEFKQKPWLSVRDIYNKMKNTKDASGLGPITNSVKKLRESRMINCKELPIKNSGRLILHYQAK